MKSLDDATLAALWHDFDRREETLRRIVADRLAEQPPPRVDDAIVASYFFVFRSTKLEDAVSEIAYHATSGVKYPPPGSLLAACTAKAAGVDPFDGSGRIGLLHVAFPLKMMLQPDGHITTSDILHTVAGAIIFDVYENQDARLVGLEVPDSVLRAFPGPAHGPAGFRGLVRLSQSEPAFGTILKPTAGITPEVVGRIVGVVAACPLLTFIKEDEDLYPNLDYSPVAERTRRAVAAIESARASRDGRGLVYAPHISGSPHEIVETATAALDAGANGLMFSETYAGGAVRMVREATKDQPVPPAIYGHNAGIGVKTRGIWREVIDFLARLDGIDFRQTAPIKPGTPFLRPYGAEWEASEHALTRPVAGIRPTMAVRAGALDQGNIGLNLEDVERRGIGENVLFLAGSAINSIENSRGETDPALGAEAMTEAIEVHRSGALRGVSAEEHLAALAALADREGLSALKTALRQRYPGQLA